MLAKFNFTGFLTAYKQKSFLSILTINLALAVTLPFSSLTFSKKTVSGKISSHPL